MKPDAMIKCTNIKDVDGEVTYSFDMNDEASTLVVEEGLKLLLYCGVCGVDIDDVYNWILQQKDKT